MIRATIRCDRCNTELLAFEAKSWSQLAYNLAAALVTTHSTIPHTSHPMSFAVDGEITGGEWEADLEIECMHEACGSERHRLWRDVPLELVGAYTLVFHTAHEGHRIRVRHGTVSFESPPPRVPENA
jgi:hypothetical protein